jgi:hypothetical protein
VSVAVIQLAPGVANADDRLLQILIAQPHPFAKGPSDEGAESTIAIISESPPNPLDSH